MFLALWFLILRIANQLRHSLAAQCLLQQARDIKPVYVDTNEKCRLEEKIEMYILKLS